MYSICDIDNHEKSVYKGHNSNIKYNEFKDTHSNKKVIRHDMRGIKFKNYNIATHEKNKMSLCAFDDKLYILDDGINTLPYGHLTFFVKDSKNKKFKSITSLIKKIVDIKGK